MGQRFIIIIYCLRDKVMFYIALNCVILSGVNFWRMKCVKTALFSCICRAVSPSPSGTSHAIPASEIYTSEYCTSRQHIVACGKLFFHAAWSWAGYNLVILTCLGHIIYNIYSWSMLIVFVRLVLYWFLVRYNVQIATNQYCGSCFGRS